MATLLTLIKSAIQHLTKLNNYFLVKIDDAAVLERRCSHSKFAVLKVSDMEELKMQKGSISISNVALDCLFSFCGVDRFVNNNWC